MSAFKLVQAFLVDETGVVAQQEYAFLVEQLDREMQQEAFCAIAFFLTVWGHKP